MTLGPGLLPALGQGDDKGGGGPDAPGCPLLTSGPMVGALEGGFITASAKVFVRANRACTVKVDYSLDPCLFGYETSVAVSATNASDLTAIVPLTNLIQDQVYYYRSVLDDCRLDVPGCDPNNHDNYASFRTPPADGDSLKNYSFAFVADVLNPVPNPSVGAPVYQALYNLTQNIGADDDPRVVFQIGDWDHRDPGMIHPATPPDDVCGQLGQPVCNTNDWRFMHRDARGSERLGTNVSGLNFSQYVQRHFAVEHIWDNHDFSGLDRFTGLDDDIANAQFPGRPNAVHAFLEYHPLHTLPNPPDCPNQATCTGGVWRKFTYGNVDFFILDLRTQRQNTGSMLGATQLLWLQNALLASQNQTGGFRRWKIILTSLAFHPTPKSMNGGWGDMDFVFERTSILQFITTNGIRNVFLVSGDLHSGGAIDAGQNSGRPEINVPHTNIISNTGSNPAENFDTASCGTGVWRLPGMATNNNYMSGRPAGSTGGCTDRPNGGPGYVLIRVLNTASPTKNIVLEVRDANNSVRVHPAEGPLSLSRDVFE